MAAASYTLPAEVEGMDGKLGWVLWCLAIAAQANLKAPLQQNIVTL